MTIFDNLRALFAPAPTLVPQAAPVALKLLPVAAAPNLITAAQIKRVASKALPHVVNAIVDQASAVLPHYRIVCRYAFSTSWRRSWWKPATCGRSRRTLTIPPSAS